MRHFLILPVLMSLHVFAQEDTSISEVSLSTEQATPVARLDPFTGKIIGSRVRLRLQPTIDSPVIKEFTSGDLVQVVGEIDDFYVLLPETEQKGYVFRTYVLDNVIEGSNVNVRLKPDMSAPVILQLQQGDKIESTSTKEHAKWVEIELPSSVRFYVAKKFIKNEGTPWLFSQRLKQKKDLLEQLNHLQESISLEFSKTFDAMDFSSIKKDLDALVEQTRAQLPEISKQASSLLKKMQETYFQLSVDAKQHREASKPIELPAPQPLSEEPASAVHEPKVSFYLQEQEKTLVQKRLANREASSCQELYEQEQKNPVLLRGKLVPFERAIKIKPGDFLLIHPTTKVPVAYVYSTTVNLDQYVGTTVSLQAATRPNHDFALPAYFVHIVTPIK